MHSLLYTFLKQNSRSVEGGRREDVDFTHRGPPLLRKEFNTPM